MTECAVDGCFRRVFGREWCSAHYNRWLQTGNPGNLLIRRYSKKNEIANWIADVALRHNLDDCLIWPFGRHGNGYGSLVVAGRKVEAHRYICEVTIGPAANKDHQAAHSCGKGHLGCVAPNHLRWATPAENAADRVAHGNQVAGERHPRSKLTEDQAIKIATTVGPSDAVRAAKEFGVDRSTIDRIRNRTSWKHIEATRQS